MADELSIDIKNFLERDSTKSFLKAAEQFIELVEMNTLSQTGILQENLSESC